eukprot:12575003-Alexandrium_andersonii.AAC.1
MHVTLWPRGLSGCRRPRGLFLARSASSCATRTWPCTYVRSDPADAQFARPAIILRSATSPAPPPLAPRPLGLPEASGLVSCAIDRATWDRAGG